MKITRSRTLLGVVGALTLAVSVTACGSSSNNSSSAGSASTPTAAVSVDPSLAAAVPSAIKSSGTIVDRYGRDLCAERVPGHRRQDRHRHGRRPVQRRRGEARPEDAVAAGQVRQHHPGRDVRQVQHRGLVVHDQQRARGAGHDGVLLLGRHPVGAEAGRFGRTRTRRAASRSPCRPAPSRSTT